MASPTVWLYLAIIFVTTSLFAASVCLRHTETEVPFLSACTATNRQKHQDFTFFGEAPATVDETNRANP